MDPSDPVARYLPTLGRARAEGLTLPPGDPAEERRVAALVVLASIVRREAWAQVVDLSPEAAQQLERGAPPLPDAFQARDHRRLAEDLGPRPCTACLGAGTAPAASTPADAAPARCASCKGGGRMRRTRLLHVHDRLIEVRELYAPPEMSFVPALFSFEGTLKRSLGAADPPEPLRCLDLRPRAVRTAYRGGGDRVVEPEFYSHRFAGTIEIAAAALAALAAGRRVVAQAVRAYAWPLLWLRYGPGEPARDVVVFPDLTGALQVFAGAAQGGREGAPREKLRARG
ncbi:hypothetical protein [Sorangium sp. So ce406]|uniref:hypothetical protein n=1 Tax=Sorangium sp. So ce406 TaxID=3133311 RepID=UPI003F5C9F3A